MQSMPNLSSTNTLENQNQTDNIDYWTDPDSNLSTSPTIHFPDKNLSQQPPSRILKFSTVPSPSQSTIQSESTHKTNIILPRHVPISILTGDSEPPVSTVVTYNHFKKIYRQS